MKMDDERTMALFGFGTLLGGYVLRQVMVDVGQESTWTRYDTQYNAELMQRLRD
jgi:hypothetical protein